MKQNLITKIFNLNLNLKTMKHTYVKLGILALMLTVGTALQAQTTTATIGKQTDATLGQVTTGAAATAGADVYTAPTAGAVTQGGAIRVIDNKGTKKYLQVQNGITQVTDTAPAGGIITTWQLGGDLVDDTEIDFNGSALSFENVVQVNPAATDGSQNPATITIEDSDGSTLGWTLLVRDEATGNIKKMLASDLIVSGQTVFTAVAAASDGIATGTELDFDVATAGAYNGAAVAALTGVKIPLPTYEKVWVYRNGAKLVANIDYTISGSKVTLVPNTTAPNDWKVYAGDVIEVQYFK